MRATCCLSERNTTYNIQVLEGVSLFESTVVMSAMTSGRVNARKELLRYMQDRAFNWGRGPTTIRLDVLGVLFRSFSIKLELHPPVWKDGHFGVPLAVFSANLHE